jgi:DNA-directed RNA polymerase specialized sigma24 family protein
MSQHQLQNSRRRDAAYAGHLDHLARGCAAPPQVVLQAESIRAYRIGRRCRGLTQEEAEDFAQEYCLKVVVVWAKWDQERALLPFLNALLFRELANFGRRRARGSLRGRLRFGAFGEPDEDAEATIPEPAAATAEPGDIAIHREYLSLVKCAINRAILELTIEGASEEEIVEVLALPNHQRVWNGRSRGLQNIRAHTQAE